jgi:glutamyl-tRNA synthetase
VPTGRFAPSPTGPLHVGNLRTAVLAWLFARSAGAPFLLRIDDLDRAASREEHVRSHVDDLQALGIDWDGEVVRQSERFDRYEAALARLDADGLLYPCYCTRREVQAALAAPHGPSSEGAYPGTCHGLTAAARAAREAGGRRPSWRVQAGGERVEVADRRHGRFTGLVDDFVVRRSDGTPAYQVAVVVDDHDQGVGEVVRGDDLLHTTPRQVWLARRLGLDVPAYAHVPLVLGPDGRRLAKRHGAVTLSDLRARGVAPSAVLGAMAASLAPAGADPVAPVDSVAPVASVAELLADFDADRLPAVPWRFDPARV